MPLYVVTKEQTIILTHLIEAPSQEQAEMQMRTPGHVGLRRIFEDDHEEDYRAVPYENWRKENCRCDSSFTCGVCLDYSTIRG